MKKIRNVARKTEAGGENCEKRGKKSAFYLQSKSMIPRFHLWVFLSVSLPKLNFGPRVSTIMHKVIFIGFSVLHYPLKAFHSSQTIYFIYLSQSVNIFLSTLHTVRISVCTAPA